MVLKEFEKHINFLVFVYAIVKICSGKQELYLLIFEFIQLPGISEDIA